MRYVTIIMGLLLLWGCSDNNIAVKDSAYFMHSDLQEATLQIMGEEDYVYDLRIQEGGYNLDEFNGGLFVDYDYLVKYNATNSTDYEMLDEDYFSFDPEFKIDADTTNTTVPLTVHTNDLFKNHGMGTYYIPIGLKNKTFGGEISKEKANFLLALTLEKPTIELVEKGAYEIDPEEASEFELDLRAKLNTKSSVDLEIQYKIDTSLIESSENVLDPEFYSFEEEVVIPKGKRSAENKIKVDVENAPGGVWKIPVQLTTDNDKISVEEDAFVLLSLNKGTLENLKWSEKYLITSGDKERLVIGPDGNSDLKIAEFKDDGSKIGVNSSEEWLQAKISGGSIEITADDYQGAGDDSRTAELSVYYPDGEYSKNIEVEQMSSASVISKDNWNIEAGNNYTTATNDEPFSNIIDGDIDSHWQWDWTNGDDSDFPSTPYEFIIDLSEAQVFNTIKLWQTQNATNGYVKDVQFEVSNDKTNWTDLGEYQMSESTDDAEAKGADPYVYELSGAYEVRYLKLIILSNVGDDEVNNAKNAYMGELDISFE